MTTSDDEVDEEGTRLAALDAARRAVQFLESKQATGCFILLTDADRTVIWDSHLTPSPHPIGDAANVLSEMGSRLRQVWYDLITGNFSENDRGFLRAVKDEDED